jgi:hypothetical protein
MGRKPTHPRLDRRSSHWSAPAIAQTSTGEGCRRRQCCHLWDGLQPVALQPLTQINKTAVKRLVPVWNYSFDDDRSEEARSLIYRGSIYVTTAAEKVAVDAKTGKQFWKTTVDYAPETPRVVCCGIK